MARDRLPSPLSGHSVPATMLACSALLLPFGVPNAVGAAPGPSPGPQRVAPVVTQVPVPDVSVAGAPRLAALSRPHPVTGFGVVGATWAGRPPAGLRLSVRTRDAGRWTRWTPLPVSDGPDPGSRDARHGRPGSDPLAVGAVDSVQLRARSRRALAPADLTLTIVDPGRSAVDAAAGGAGVALRTPLASVDAQPAAFAHRAGATVRRTTGTAGVRAPRPRIRTRAEWGADEGLRSGSPDFGRVRAGFVHHTVNANGYSRRDVPAIIRGVYAYHTQSRGWSDIGYNFLVDRFGRIWFGRYGGGRRAVIGAHTYGYNDVTTGVAAIGDLESARPSRYLIGGLGRLLGWKLGVHGVHAGDRRQYLGTQSFRAVSGHRDAGQTACPGVYLYPRLDDIRRIAVRRQRR